MLTTANTSIDFETPSRPEPSARPCAHAKLYGVGCGNSGREVAGAIHTVGFGAGLGRRADRARGGGGSSVTAGAVMDDSGHPHGVFPGSIGDEVFTNDDEAQVPST